MTRTLPASTYRLQLRGGVDFARATDLVDYLARLGVDWLYLSPPLHASEGSGHGYDIVDPSRFDPELGTREDFARLVERLRGANMGLLVDIVPNHMRASIENPWWRDQLEHGVASRYSGYFDIRWSLDSQNRLVLPVLGRHYGEALERGELVLSADALGLVVRYHDNAFPLDPRTWAAVLRRVPGRKVAELADACAELPPAIDDPKVRERRAIATPQIRERLTALRREDPDFVDGLSSVLQGRDGLDCDRLHDLLEAQPYRLAYWRSGLDELNYRRFFDINDLVALRMERQDVFDDYHRFILDFVAAGDIQGLRVDHVDGLADPREYLERLRARGARCIVVEKILQHDEELPPDWACEGTTGYDFIPAVGPLFVDIEGARALEEDFRSAGTAPDFDACADEATALVLSRGLAPSLHSLASDLRRLSDNDRRARDVSRLEFERALAAITAALPVYRTYVGSGGPSEVDRARLAEALTRARERLPRRMYCALDFIGRVVDGDAESIPGARAFVRRWEQLSGPATAKGIEDTALYRWVPNLGLCEVGCDPRPVDDPVATFLAWTARKRAREPAGLVTLSTHDTKRGADVRARLYALTHHFESYRRCRAACADALGVSLTQLEVREELELLLQTVIGAYPLANDERGRFGDRLNEYLVKAAREAKRRTSWTRPNRGAETEIVERGIRLLAALNTTEWGRQLAALQRDVELDGALIGLAQLVLAIASPGVLDVYQGSERWDLSLVDPDNRRPVDFAELQRRLEALEGERPPSVAELRTSWRDGRIKAHVLSVGLRERRRHADLFREGEVVAIPTDDDRVFAIGRKRGDSWALAIVARHPPSDEGGQRTWPIGRAWNGVALPIPSGAPRQWREAFTGAEVDAEHRLELANVLAELPFALLVDRKSST
jgi:(1->4)-alpha-D-glucan 1-alpha-D-glucosylmutase